MHLKSVQKGDASAGLSSPCSKRAPALLRNAVVDKVRLRLKTWPLMTEHSEHNPKRGVPSKGFVALLYVPLLVPAILPLYFAVNEDDPALMAIMIGTTVAVLIFNAVVLVAAYRWFSRGAEE